MRKLLILSALLGFSALPGAAFADSLGRPCTDKPQSEYLSLEALKAKVTEQGYQIRSGEISKACGEFYVLDKNGKRAELFVDPTTGKIVSGDGKGETGMTGGAPEVASGERMAPKGAAEHESEEDEKDGDD